MTRHVIMFQRRFIPLIESETKIQTIRPPRKRPIREGDTLSLRAWVGMPYRSTQEVIRDVVCEGVTPVVIHAAGVELPCGHDDPDREMFARADGFADWKEMAQWFRDTHGLPFRGVCIQWEAKP